MQHERQAAVRKLSLAACAVAVAATVGGVHAEEETKAISSIERFCAASWQNAGIPVQEWNDCTQETLCELLQRVSRKRFVNAIRDAKSSERRELIRSVWCVAQRYRRSTSHCSLDEVADTTAQVGVNSPSGGMDAEDIWELARTRLSARQQRILSMYRDGHTVREMASLLQATPARVSEEKYKAIHKLRKHASEAV